jgi:two-component sensor histidine kinase
MMVTVIVFALLSAAFYFEDNPSFIGNLVPLGICTFLLSTLYFTRKYKLVGYLILILGLAANTFNLYTYNNFDRYIDVLWMFAVALCTAYLIGIFWGILSLALSLVSLGIFTLITPKTELVQAYLKMTTLNAVDLFINLIISGTLIAIFIYKIFRTTEKVEEDLEDTVDLLKKQYEKIKIQNQEKTVLLQEVHHRVKNNLQIVSSLLKLQSYEIENPEVKAHFEEAMGRISSMALIHERMYQNNNLSEIKLRTYVSILTNDILRSITKDKSIDLNVKSDIEFIDPNITVPIALIFNELITNTIKHAVPNNGKGKIDIEVVQQEGQIDLIYQDSGSTEANINNNGFGSMLIETFVEQLDGEIISPRENKNYYHFKFGAGAEAK